MSSKSLFKLNDVSELNVYSTRLRSERDRLSFSVRSHCARLRQEVYSDIQDLIYCISVHKSMLLDQIGQYERETLRDLNSAIKRDLLDMNPILSSVDQVYCSLRLGNECGISQTEFDQLSTRLQVAMSNLKRTESSYNTLRYEKCILLDEPFIKSFPGRLCKRGTESIVNKITSIEYITEIGKYFTILENQEDHLILVTDFKGNESTKRIIFTSKRRPGQLVCSNKERLYISVIDNQKITGVFTLSISGIRILREFSFNTRYSCLSGNKSNLFGLDTQLNNIDVYNLDLELTRTISLNPNPVSSFLRADNSGNMFLISSLGPTETLVQVYSSSQLFSHSFRVWLSSEAFKSMYTMPGRFILIDSKRLISVEWRNEESGRVKTIQNLSGKQKALLTTSPDFSKSYELLLLE